MRLAREYLIAALPAAVTISVALLTPLLVTGQFQIAFSGDGGGRAISDDGVCCHEPAYYYISRLATQFALPAFVLSAIWIWSIWTRERQK